MSMQPITVETIDRIKPMIFDIATRYRKSLRGCRYADIRVQVDEAQSATAENGGSKHSSKDYDFTVGIRALSGNGMAAPGYFGRSLGAADLDRLRQIVKVVSATRTAAPRPTPSKKRPPKEPSALWRMPSPAQHLPR